MTSANFPGNNPELMEKKLYLIPVGIAQEGSGQVSGWPLPELFFQNAGVVFAENFRSARRSLRRAGYSGDLDGKLWIEIKRGIDIQEVMEAFKTLTGDIHGIILSEAGMPCIADPGSEVVALAHSFGIRVIPIPGPSSIFLALAASGLDGQQFVFHGYLPVKPFERNRKLKDLAHQAMLSGYTQIIMETPYRNQAMIESLLNTLPEDLRLCIASDVTGPGEKIITRPVGEWKKTRPNPGKVPALFLFGR